MTGPLFGVCIAAALLQFAHSWAIASSPVSLTEETCLLQTHLHVYMASRGTGHELAIERAAPRIDTALERVMPIEWMHIPKTGSSFMNTLIHLPGVCPGLPVGFKISETTTGGNMGGVGGFNNMYERFSCNTSALDPEFSFTHSPVEMLPGGFDAGKGRYMAFLRQPEQCMLSNYYFAHNSNRRITGSMSIDQLKYHLSGTYTKMLVRPDWPVSSDNPTRHEIDEAKRRLQGFAFLGITDQWALSICLFNTMFNQRCHSTQFDNIHPTFSAEGCKPPYTCTEAGTRFYDTGILKGWHDPYDGEVFDAGMKIFKANLMKYNVSESSCEPCWREARVFEAVTHNMA